MSEPDNRGGFLPAAEDEEVPPPPSPTQRPFRLCAGKDGDPFTPPSFRGDPAKVSADARDLGWGGGGTRVEGDGDGDDDSSYPGSIARSVRLRHRRDADELFQSDLIRPTNAFDEAMLVVPPSSDGSILDGGATEEWNENGNVERAAKRRRPSLVDAAAVMAAASNHADGSGTTQAGGSSGSGAYAFGAASASASVASRGGWSSSRSGSRGAPARTPLFAGAARPVPASHHRGEFCTSSDVGSLDLNYPRRPDDPIAAEAEAPPPHRGWSRLDDGGGGDPELAERARGWAKVRAFFGEASAAPFDNGEEEEETMLEAQEEESYPWTMSVFDSRSLAGSDAGIRPPPPTSSLEADRSAAFASAARGAPALGRIEEGGGGGLPPAGGADPDRASLCWSESEREWHEDVASLGYKFDPRDESDYGIESEAGGGGRPTAVIALDDEDRGGGAEPLRDDDGAVAVEAEKGKGRGDSPERDHPPPSPREAAAAPPPHLPPVEEERGDGDRRDGPSASGTAPKSFGTAVPSGDGSAGRRAGGGRSSDDGGSKGSDGGRPPPPAAAAAERGGGRGMFVIAPTPASILGALAVAAAAADGSASSSSVGSGDGGGGGGGSGSDASFLRLARAAGIVGPDLDLDLDLDDDDGGGEVGTDEDGSDDAESSEDILAAERKARRDEEDALLHGGGAGPDGFGRSVLSSTGEELLGDGTTPPDDPNEEEWDAEEWEEEARGRMLRARLRATKEEGEGGTSGRGWTAGGVGTSLAAG